MKIYIKNIVCDRCKMVIKSQLESMNLEPVSVELGEVDFGEVELSSGQIISFKDKIEPLGFELISDRKSRLIEKIKSSIIDLVHIKDEFTQINVSDYLKSVIDYDYNYLSNLFSSVEGITIEQYLIKQKIEKVKEFLVYDELTLSEISYKLGYSSVAHLSSQFKKVTGMTPTYFKNLRDAKQRKTLDNL